MWSLQKEPRNCHAIRLCHAPSSADSVGALVRTRCNNAMYEGPHAKVSLLQAVDYGYLSAPRSYQSQDSFKSESSLDRTRSTRMGLTA